MATPSFNYNYQNIPADVLFTDIAISGNKIVISGLSDTYLYNNDVSAIRVSFTLKTVTTASILPSCFLSDSTTAWLAKGDYVIASETASLSFYKSVDYSTYTVTSNAVVTAGSGTEVFASYVKILRGNDDFYLIPNTYGESLAIRSFYMSDTSVNASITISSSTSFSHNCYDALYADSGFIYVITDSSGTLCKITTGGTVTVLTTGVFACCQYSITSSVAYFAGDSGKLLRIVKSTDAFTDLSFSGSATINAMAVDDDEKIVMVGDSGKIVIRNNGAVNTYDTTGAKTLASAFYYSGTFYVAGDGIILDFESNPTEGNWDISFQGIDFNSNGVFVQSWNDDFKKNIATEPNKITHGGFSNRFSYFGLNQISLSGFITTSTISALSNQIRNKTSYGFGRLYKRTGIYCNAELKNFDILPHKGNGYYFTFQAKFYADRPYYYRDINLGIETNFSFADTVTGQSFYTNLAIDIDDVEISYIASITSTVNYFITAGYDVLCTKNDTTPTASSLTASDWASVSYLDNNKNSVGIKMLYSTTIKRFYLRGSALSATYPHSVFDDFDIYYKTSASVWAKYNDPFRVQIKNIPSLGNVFYFDGLNVNTKEIKVNFNSTATRNLINYADNRSKVISFVLPEKFSMIKTNNFSDNLRIDTKAGEVWKDGSLYSAEGQLLRLYSDVTNFWAFIGGSASIKVLTNYKQTYFPI